MALNTLSIVIASTLHVFDISAGVDVSGKPVELSTEIVGALIWYAISDGFMITYE